MHRRAVRSGGDGNHGLLRRHPGLGLGHGGARLRKGDLQVRRVQLDQQVALLHRLVVLHQHARHRAGDARRHRGDVAIHLGVVGVFELARVQPPEQPRHGYDRETNTDPQSHAAGSFTHASRPGFLATLNKFRPYKIPIFVWAK